MIEFGKQEGRKWITIMITITIMIMIMIMIMMRGHLYNLPTPVIDRLPLVGLLLLTLCDKMCIIWAILSHMRE